MNGQMLAEDLRAQGYRLILTNNWQKVRVQGYEPPSNAQRQQVIENKKGLRFWLMSEALTEGLSGKILNQVEVDVPAEYWQTYPTGKGQSSQTYRPRTASLGSGSPCMDPWLASADAILGQKDEMGRFNATRSEIDTCIIGLRGLPHPDAKRMVAKLEQFLPEAKKCTGRLMARAKWKNEA